MSSFKFLNYTLNFDKDFEIYHYYQTFFNKMSEGVFNKCTENKDIKNKLLEPEYYFNGIPEMYRIVIDSMEEIALQILVEEFKIYNYTKDYFEENLERDEETIKNIMYKWDKIIKDYGALLEQREYERAGRSQWYGAGIGIGGALKAQAKAGILNAGTNFFRSIGDSIKDSNDKAKFKKAIKAELNYSIINDTFLDIESTAFNIFYVFIEILENERIIREIEDTADEAEAIYENIKKYVTDEEEKLEKAIECLQLDPSCEEYYIFISEIMNDSVSNELINIAKNFGLGEFAINLKNDLLKKKTYDGIFFNTIKEAENAAEIDKLFNEKNDLIEKTEDVNDIDIIIKVIKNDILPIIKNQEFAKRYNERLKSLEKKKAKIIYIKECTVRDIIFETKKDAKTAKTEFNICDQKLEEAGNNLDSLNNLLIFINENITLKKIKDIYIKKINELILTIRKKEEQKALELKKAQELEERTAFGDIFETKEKAEQALKIVPELKRQLLEAKDSISKLNEFEVFLNSYTDSTHKIKSKFYKAVKILKATLDDSLLYGIIGETRLLEEEQRIKDEINSISNYFEKSIFDATILKLDEKKEYLQSEGYREMYYKAENYERSIKNFENMLDIFTSLVKFVFKCIGGAGIVALIGAGILKYILHFNFFIVFIIIFVIYVISLGVEDIEDIKYDFKSYIKYNKIRKNPEYKKAWEFVTSNGKFKM